MNRYAIYNIRNEQLGIFRADNMKEALQKGKFILGAQADHVAKVSK